jgi:hypothetical protein
LKEQRDLNTGLWHINVRSDKLQPTIAAANKVWNTNVRSDMLQPTIAAANKVYELRNTGDLVHYLHKAMFNQTKSALVQAVKKGHITTWPGAN